VTTFPDGRSVFWGSVLSREGNSILHTVRAYCETHQTSWRSVCSAHCPWLLWDSPNILEICLFCTLSMPTLRLTKHLGDLSVLHTVHDYCETHQTSWRSVCSAHCPCLLGDSPNILEICLFCTLSMTTGRLTKHLGDLSVLHTVHAYCEIHQTSWRSVCSAHCPWLLWDSPNILEICLFCTLSMPTVRLAKHLGDVFFCTLSMPTLRLTKHLGDLSVLHTVHAYSETHQTSWRSVCSAHCPCLMWDSPNFSEICLFCTLSMSTVRLTKHLGDLSVLHTFHASCETHQTSWRSVCSAHSPCLLQGSPNIFPYFQHRYKFFIFSFPPRAKKRLDKNVMQFTLLQQELQASLFIFDCDWNQILNSSFVIYTSLRWVECYSFFKTVAAIHIWRRRRGTTTLFL